MKKKILCLVLACLMLFGTISTAFAADENVSVSGITITTDGSNATSSIFVHTTYQVKVEIKNTKTYSVSPSVALYEVKSGQPVSVDQKKAAGELAAGAQTALNFAWTPAEIGEYTLRAVVTTSIDGTDTQLDLEESTVIAAANPNYISVNDFYQPTSKLSGYLYSWGIDGADVVGCEKVKAGTGNYPDTTFNIKLKNGTPMNTALNVLCDAGPKQSCPIINSQPGLTKAPRVTNYNEIKKSGKVPVKLKNGMGTLSLYVYSYAGDTVGTVHTINFSIAAADTSNDPKPEDVASIAITTPPTRTAYSAGDLFDPSGMVVTAALKSGGSVSVAGYTLVPSGELTLTDTAVAVSFGGLTLTQVIKVLPSTGIIDTKITNGQMMGDIADNNFGQYEKKENGYDAVVLYGESKGHFNITVSDGAGVFIGDVAQTVTDGKCELFLDASADGTATTVRIKAGESYSDYTFTCYAQQLSGMPTSVIEYFCIASQYTNGSGFGPYGLNAVPTLRGMGTYSETSWDGINGGPTSLGNFGGYITYYYKDAISDNPKNPYGVDFIVYGNSYDGSDNFAEPGNVLVSEDGKTWYSLAGSLHYDNCADWGYSMTYTKNGSASSMWTDNRGGSGTGDKYPLKEYYPLFAWTAEREHQITLTGVALDPSKEKNIYGNTLPPYPDFGYADSGYEGESNVADNPYTGTVYKPWEGRVYSGDTDGFDLKWAVDENGLPVALPNGIHYVKIQTANNINSGGGGIGEKSTEIHMVRTAAPAESAVGMTTAPSSVTIDGSKVAFEDGKFVYNVPVHNSFTVSVVASSDANVYINGTRASTLGFAKIPDHSMLRVIVQEGMKEPVIYYFNLTDDGTGAAEWTTTVTMKGDGGDILGKNYITRCYTTFMIGTVLPIPTLEGYTFTGWFSCQKVYTSVTAQMPESMTLTAQWKKNSTDEKETGTINVSFRLIGATLASEDVDLSVPVNDSKYVTWIPTSTYTMPKDSTVYDLFTKALGDAGMTALGQDSNYVTTIYAPAACGGYVLSEMTNGKYSGWMYTLNGSHPLLGLKQQLLSDGNMIVWHYINDYRYEVADWAKLGGTGFPALGNGTYWNKWLDAPDTAPTKANNSGASTGTEGNITITPNATATNGAAAVSIDATDLSDAITSAKKNSGNSITITPTITGTVSKVTVELPKTSLSSIASDTDASLMIKTAVGSVTLPNSTLDSIASQASGSTVTVSLNTVDAKALTSEQQKAVGSGTVYDVSVLSGSAKISAFDNSTITISLPYALKSGEDQSGVAIWYMDDSGNLQQMTATYDATTGLATFTTTHLSYYVVGYTAPWSNPFYDVKSTDWFYSAVKYNSQKSLMSGTSASAFEPNSNMTRAMLVTVLYRLGGKPPVAETNVFTDVENEQWYSDAVTWASANKIVSGYGSGLFGTDDSITREQLAVIMYNYAKHKGYDVTKTTDLNAFSDAASVSSWAEPAMKWAVSNGYITGEAAAMITPTGDSSRAQVATIFMRFMENIKK